MLEAPAASPACVVECSLVDSDDRCPVRQVVDTDDIEADRATIVEALQRQICHRHPDYAPLFRRGDRLCGRSKFAAGLPPDLDENHRVAIPGNDVDFSMGGPVPSFKNCVPARLEFRDSEILA